MKIQLWHTENSVLYFHIATMRHSLSSFQAAKSFLFVLETKEFSELDTLYELSMRN